MNRGSVSHDLGLFPTLGLSDYRGNGIGGQKGWSSERVPLPTSSGQRHIVNGNTSLMGLSNGGRTMPSKWEDAERWICSPVIGYGESNKSSHSQDQQRRHKSKSGPIVPPSGVVHYSNYSPANPAFDGGIVRNFMIGSPFSTGILAADSVSLQYGGSGGTGRSSSVLGLSELQSEFIPIFNITMFRVRYCVCCQTINFRIRYLIEILINHGRFVVLVSNFVASSILDFLELCRIFIAKINM